MEENLIDEYWLFVNPILLGNGIPLFKNIKTMTKLKLMSTQAFDSSVIGSNYCVEK
ncbi:MAG: dihydrofolate reductase family protein [Leptospiraceae bacterium]|nr:dihydrofolate reductase family protein [Leptospiraceae bacterium]